MKLAFKNEFGEVLCKSKRVYVPSAGGRKAYYRQDPRSRHDKESSSYSPGEVVSVDMGESYMSKDERRALGNVKGKFVKNAKDGSLIVAIIPTAAQEDILGYFKYEQLKFKPSKIKKGHVKDKKETKVKDDSYQSRFDDKMDRMDTLERKIKELSKRYKDSDTGAHAMSARAEVKKLKRQLAGISGAPTPGYKTGKSPAEKGEAAAKKENKARGYK